MSSKAEAQSGLSQVLFMSVKGEPLRFFLRPGATKLQLHQTIMTAGGVVCRTQEPGAILLADPEEMEGIPATVAHFYVSTQYIKDCVERNEQLDMEDYRFSRDQVQPEKSKMEGSGRMGYTAEDDAAILSFVKGRTNQVRGNRIWQEMERQGVTGHSWQSMKDRYRKHLIQQLEDRQMEDLIARTHSCKADPPQSSLVREPSHPSPEKTCPQPMPEKNNPEEPHSPPLSEASCPKPEYESTPCQYAKGKRPSQSPENSPVQSVSRKMCRVDPKEKLSPEKAEVNVEPRGSSGSNKSSPALQKENVKVLRTSSVRKKLGILEAAIMEFEESDQETLDSGDSTEDQPELRPASPEAHCSSTIESNNQARKNRSSSAPSASKCLFERESEEDKSNGCLPFSQVQLEQAKKDLRSLMNESKQDLVTVTKALLKNSGNMHASSQYLLAQQSVGTDRPFWDRHDDELLLSSDPLQHKLCEKYGEEGVAKRMAFLETK